MFIMCIKFNWFDSSLMNSIYSCNNSCCFFSWKITHGIKNIKSFFFLEIGKTKFQSSWRKDRPWLVSVKNSVYEAMCRVCADNLNVTSGTGVIKTLEKRPKHLNNLEKSKYQLQFIINKKGSLSLGTVDGRFFLTFEEQNWKSEILHVLNMVDENFSFQSCVSDNYLYPKMSSTKVIYINNMELLNTSKMSWLRRCRRNLLLFILMNLPPHKLKNNTMVMSNSFHWNQERLLLYIMGLYLLEDVQLQTWWII